MLKAGGVKLPALAPGQTSSQRAWSMPTNTYHCQWSFPSFEKESDCFSLKMVVGSHRPLKVTGWFTGPGTMEVLPSQPKCIHYRGKIHRAFFFSHNARPQVIVVESDFQIYLFTFSTAVDKSGITLVTFTKKTQRAVLHSRALVNHQDDTEEQESSRTTTTEGVMFTTSSRDRELQLTFRTWVWVQGQHWRRGGLLLTGYMV